MFSALVIRDLAAAVERSQQPGLAGRPLVLLHGERQLKTLAIDALAREAGVQAGDSRKQAELLCPEAAWLPSREEVYRRCFDAVTVDLAAHIDRVEAQYDPGDGFWLVETAHDAELAVLRRRIESQLGGTVAVGKGSGKFVARLAGLSGPEGRAVERGEEAEFLAPLPVTLLPLNADMRRRLPMMGIRRIGDYVALSREAVFEQWQRQGCFCYDLALGRDTRPLQASQLPPLLKADLAFEDPIADKEALLAACLHLAPALLKQLQGRVAGRLVLLLTDESQRLRELHLRPSLPLRSLAHLRQQARLLLEKPIYSSGIVALGLQLADLAESLPEQLMLFGAGRGQRSVTQAVDAWRQRFEETVVRLSLTDAPRHFPPILQYEAVGA